MIRSKTARLFIACSAALAFLGTGPAFAICTAQGLELMRNLNGAWRGKGVVTPIGASPEFVSCRISYAMAAADVINQVIACAGADYKLEATSQVTCDGNRLDGWFRDRTGDTSGKVSGEISGNNLFIEVESITFTGNFRVIFKSENDHLVSISQPDHATGRQITVASIKLTR